MTDNTQALEVLDRVWNYCEEIDNHLPFEEKTGYRMVDDMNLLRNYISNSIPVKYGKWIKYEGVNTYLYGKYCCSVCGEKAVYDHDDYGYEINANLTDCCPHCGVRMENE